MAVTATERLIVAGVVALVSADGEVSAMAGACAAGATVTVNERAKVLFVGWPSLTVTVMTAEPLAFAVGVKAMEPLAPGDV